MTTDPRKQPIFNRSAKRPAAPSQDSYFLHHLSQKTPLRFYTITGGEHTGIIVECRNYTLLVERGEGKPKILLMKAALESVEKATI